MINKNSIWMYLSVLIMLIMHGVRKSYLNYLEYALFPYFKHTHPVFNVFPFNIFCSSIILAEFPSPRKQDILKNKMLKIVVFISELGFCLQ